MVCGCQKRATSVPGGAAHPADASAVAAPQGDPLRYRGARALLVRGPATGVGYACYPTELIRVHPRDAPHLLATGAFVRAPVE